MVPEASLDISRRQFLAAGGLTVATACFAPSYLMAQTEGIVVGAFKEAATAKVTVQNASPQHQRPLRSWWKYRRSHWP